MNNYSGKICPYCKCEIKETDDIVVCSACEMPHHRDCWIENQGCTTFGCQGTIDNPKKTYSETAPEIQFNHNPAKNAAAVFCVHCGAANHSNVKFCTSCGQPIMHHQNQVQQPVVNTSAQTAYNGGFNNAQPAYGADSYIVQQQPSYGSNPYVGQQQPSYGSNPYIGQQQPAYGSNPYSGQPQPSYGANSYTGQQFTHNNNPYGNQTSYGAAPVFAPQNSDTANPYSYVPNYSAGGQGQGYGVNLDPDVMMLIDTKSEYYIPKFQSFKAQNKKASWNWAAFLITPFWLIYRKLYVYGGAWLGSMILLSMIDSSLATFAGWIGYFVFGILGNYLYMINLEKNAQQLKTMQEPYRSEFIQKNKGVNLTAAILSLVGYLVLYVILASM